MEIRPFGQENSSKEKGDGRKESQVELNKPRSFDVLKETAKKSKEAKAKSSQERTQRSDGGSSSTLGTGKAFQKSQKDVLGQNLEKSSKREVTDEFEHAHKNNDQKGDATRPLYQECRDMIDEVWDNIQNDNLSVKELAKQAEMIAKWIETHQICPTEREKKRYLKYWDDVNTKLLYYKCRNLFKLENTKNTEKVKQSIGDYLWRAEIMIKRVEQLERLNNQTNGLEDAINLIIHHREAFEKIGYDYEQFDKIQENANRYKNKILKHCFYHVEEAYLTAYCKTIFKMSHDLETFLNIDPNLEVNKVIERKERIETLLEALPEVRPTLSDLPREQWWKLYIDVLMHKEAQKLSDPGHYFDQDESPGYQQSMTDLFKQVLVPAQNGSRESMNYEDYTKIHDIATEHIPDNRKSIARTPIGFSIGYRYNRQYNRLDRYYNVEEEMRYSLANVGDKEMYERIAAFQELREEHVNGLSILQDWRSTKYDITTRTQELAQYPPDAIAVSWVNHTCEVNQNICFIGDGGIEIMTAYEKKDGPRHVNAILQRYYQGRARPNQTEYQRLTEIARTVRALHVMHPKGDANGRTHIFGLMNKWLIEEGFPPAILPNGPGVFGGLKTLEGLVEDMLEGMHAFVNAVEESRKEATARSSSPEPQKTASDRSRPRSTRG